MTETNQNQHPEFEAALEALDAGNIDCGADINLANNQGKIALFWARKQNHEKAVALLCRHGASE